MRAIYRPKRNMDESLIAGREVAYVAVVPDNWGTQKKWPWCFSVHGVGERSNGRIDHLENLVYGAKQTDGTRKYPFVSDDMKKAVDLYQMVFIIPTYENGTFFNASKANWVYNQVVNEFSLEPEYWDDGFSYGGGAVLSAITNSLTSDKIVFATPCSPTRDFISAGIGLIAQNKTIVHVYVNNQDDNPSTNLSVTKSIVADINKSNPQVPVVYTAFNQYGHSGSHEKAMSLTPPKAPGGEGFIDAAENNYEYFFDILKNGPRPMKSGTGIVPGPVVIDPPAPPITLLQPVLEHKVIGNTVYLDGSKSTGMKSAKLAAVTVPNGVNIWNTSIEGGGSAVGKITLTTPGVYKFRLTIYPEVGYKGTPAEADVEVTIGTAQPEPFKPTHTITRADGTKEQVRIETL